VDAGEQRILNTLRMLEVREIPRDRVALARWMRIHPNGGRFNRQLASLRAKGHVDGIELTADGRAMADLGETGPDAAVAAVKGNTTRNVLKEIAKSPTSLGREDLAAKLGIHPNGGRFNRDLAWLRAMGLIPERGRIETTDGYLR
jgi:predicted ArsR family transcriptional regulator